MTPSRSALRGCVRVRVHARARSGAKLGERRRVVPEDERNHNAAALSLTFYRGEQEAARRFSTCA